MTPKQLAFCRHYISTKFNASEAARRAGYSPHRVNVTSSQLLANPSIQEEIDRMIKKEFSNLDREAYELLRLIKHACVFDLRKIAKWGPEGVELIDSDSLDDMDALMVSEVSETITRDGGSKKIKAIPKEKAWEMMAKITSLIEPDKLIIKDDNDDEEKKQNVKERIAYLLEKRGAAN